jgi:ABC-type uncharacterized transport system ATPase subunit
LIPGFTLTENVALGVLKRAGRWLDWKRLTVQTGELLAAFDVRAPGPATRAEALSGGNQQKLILARGLAHRPRVLVAEQPTRGLDILATEAVHQRLRDAADQGVLVVMHSSDLDEVLALADRVMVMTGGELRAMPTDATREQVGDAMLGLDSAA